MTKLHDDVLQNNQALMKKLQAIASNCAQEARRLYDNVDQRAHAAGQAHKAFLQSVEVLVTQSKNAEAQIVSESQAGREMAGSLAQAGYHRVQQLMAGLDGLASDIEAMGDGLWYELHESERAISMSNMQEASADAGRDGQLSHIMAQFARLDILLSQIVGSIGDAQRTVAASVEFQQTTEKMQRADAALDLNQQAAVAQAQGWLETSVALLEMAVQQSPDDVTLRLNLAEAYLATRRTSRAAEQLAAATRLSPDSPRVAHIAGCISLRRGESESAVELLSRSVTLAPDEPDYRLSLAEAYYMTNRSQKAIEQWRRILESDPDHPLARHYLTQIADFTAH